MISWQQLRQQVLKRDKYTCQQCHKQSDKLQVDHIVPVRKGGLNGLQNLKTICYDCHIEKHRWDGVERSTSRMIMSVLDEVFGPKAKT